MQRKLSEHINDDYSLVGIKPGVVVISGKRYDFRTITKKEADTLYQNGCRYLKKKVKPAEKVKKDRGN